eukprot:NODE_215_length_3379_cov_5.593481.p1 GENE.NODE_215_length_3379_cov_5.593481~~NODE_215_length_3379_cov_5.593481.p1  ORF type:complete len:1049 (-),score=221.01 NODE_215_length_3379_cov_5.593481:169-3315(-)
MSVLPRPVSGYCKASSSHAVPTAPALVPKEEGDTQLSQLQILRMSSEQRGSSGGPTTGKVSTGHWSRSDVLAAAGALTLTAEGVEQHQHQQQQHLPDREPICESVASEYPVSSATSVASLDNTRLPWTVEELRAQRELKVHEVERRMKEVAGLRLSALRMCDIHRDATVCNELAQLSLNEYFDDYGVLRVPQIGIDLTATRLANQEKRGGWHGAGRSGIPTPVEPGRGSRATCPESEIQESGDGQGELSARAYLLMAEAKEKDIAFGRELRRRADELCHSRGDATTNDSITATTSNGSTSIGLCHRVCITQKRYLDVLFCEVPTFEQYIPEGVVIGDMLMREKEEVQERILLDRLQRLFADGTPPRDWLVDRAELLALMMAANLWARAAHGEVAILGLDRPTFCRFILDVGLVDQDKVPYHWAVSKYDEYVQHIRLSPPAAQATNTATPPNLPPPPLVHVVNWWNLGIVLSDILRRIHKKQVHTQGVKVFLDSVFRIAQACLPESIIAESGHTEQMHQAILTGSIDAIEESSDYRGSNDFMRMAPIFHVASPMAAPIAAPLTQVVSPTVRNSLADARGGGGDRHAHTVAKVRSMSRQQMLRMQHCHSKLVEPEVLQLVTQHVPVFKLLHSCYADEGGHMSYPALLQFCLDFHLSPRCLSQHLLAQCYEAVACVDTPGLEPKWVLRKTYDETGGVVPPWKLAANSANAWHALEKNSNLVSPSSLDTPAPDTEGHSVPTTSRLMTRSTTSRTAEKHHKSPSSRRSIRSTAPDSSDERGGKSSVASFGHPRNMPECARVVCDKLPPATFGMNAFIEVLCRAALVYLGSYGNSYQLDADSSTCIVWLVMYLRHALTCLIASHAKRPEGGNDGDNPHPALRRTLQQLTTEMWRAQPVPLPVMPRKDTRSITISLARPQQCPAQNPRRGSAEGTRSTKRTMTAISKTAKDDAPPCVAANQMGTRFQVDPHCSRCEAHRANGRWGNPRCRGCSSVSALVFADHPFAALLLGRPPNERPPISVDRPRNLHRLNWTPPPPKKKKKKKKKKNQTLIKI